MSPARVNLSAAAKRQLRKMGRSCAATVRVGKAGLTEATTAQVKKLLAERELVKVKVLETAGISAAELADRLSEAAGAAVVDVVGRAAVLYRPNPKLPESKRIKLE
jgi:RNA-binding protein